MCGWIPERKEGRKKIELCIIQLTLAIKDRTKANKENYICCRIPRKKKKKPAMHIVFKLKSRRSLNLAIFNVRMQGCMTKQDIAAKRESRI